MLVFLRNIPIFLFPLCFSWFLRGHAEEWRWMAPFLVPDSNGRLALPLGTTSAAIPRTASLSAWEQLRACLVRGESACLPAPLPAFLLPPRRLPPLPPEVPLNFVM